MFHSPGVCGDAQSVGTILVSIDHEAVDRVVRPSAHDLVHQDLVVLRDLRFLKQLALPAQSVLDREPRHRRRHQRPLARVQLRLVRLAGLDGVHLLQQQLVLLVHLVHGGAADDLLFLAIHQEGRPARLGGRQHGLDGDQRVV